jgi:hypothetical protein
MVELRLQLDRVFLYNFAGIWVQLLRGKPVTNGTHLGYGLADRISPHDSPND